ncbi:hypothetical protein TNCV_3717961, partial [Trichonephila clavipes]
MSYMVDFTMGNSERRYGSVPFHGRQCPCHRTVAAEQLLSEDIERMDLAGMTSGSQSHQACMGFSRQALAARTLPPVTIRGFDWPCKTDGQQCLNNSLTHP